MFWLGAWNLEQYDCSPTPYISQCNQNLVSPTTTSHPNTDQPKLVPWPSSQNAINHDPFPMPNDHHRKSPLDNALERGLISTGAGFVMLFFSDTLYGNAGLGGGLFSACHNKPQSALQYVLLSFRLTIGLIGTTAAWSGLYTILQESAPGKKWTLCRGLAEDPDYCERDLVVHGLTFAVGIFILTITGTYNNTTYLYPSSDKPNFLQKVFFFHDVEDVDSLTPLDHFRYSIRSILSVFAQTLLWFSSTRALDLTTPHIGGDIVWRPLFFAAIGWVVLCMTNSFVENSFMDIEDKIEEQERDELLAHHSGSIEKVEVEESKDLETAPSMLEFYVTSFISLCGQLIFQYGVWETLDVFVVETSSNAKGKGVLLMYRTTEMNLLLVFIGTVMLVISGVLLTNASITLSPVYATKPAQAPVALELTVNYNGEDNDDDDDDDDDSTLLNPNTSRPRSSSQLSPVKLLDRLISLRKRRKTKTETKGSVYQKNRPPKRLHGTPSRGSKTILL